MSWEMQVEVLTDDGKMKFQSVCCSGKHGYTYRYPTKGEAELQLRHCYPGVSPEQLKVIEVNKPANIRI